MESISDVHCKQFLIAEKESVGNIHKPLCNVCRNAAVDRSTIDRLAKRVTSSETGKAKLHDLPRLGRPGTAVSPEMLQHADAFIC
jgi:hypothetical protein